MADVEALYTVMDRLCQQFPSKMSTLNSMLSIGGIEPTLVQSITQTQLSQTAETLLSMKGQQVQINYESHSSGTSIRTITPIEIFVDNNMEFVVAYCHRRMENLNLQE